MSRYHSYLTSSEKFISNYQGKEPLNVALKRFFSSEKKYGSSDRKVITELCYGYYRTYHLFRTDQTAEALIKAWFLLHNTSTPLLQALRPAWDILQLSQQEKFTFLEKYLHEIFPFNSHLSSKIDTKDFLFSLLIQPDVFIRMRPGKEEVVTDALDSAKISFMVEDEYCLRLKASEKLHDVLNVNRDAVIQDVSSQHTLDFLSGYKTEKILDVWDCCAASGGKSILAFDLLRNVRLDVSDKRESILNNLQQRLQDARVPLYRSFQIDLEEKSHPLKYDIIICDAPCSGSGTWSRSPEQAAYFSDEKLRQYTALQQRIIDHSISSLKTNGVFCYITCSVFREENEEMVNYLSSKGFKLLHSSYHKGYERKADTLFSAFFTAG